VWGEVEGKTGDECKENARSFSVGLEREIWIREERNKIGSETNGDQ